MSLRIADILEACKAEFESIRHIRRDIHMHPEIGFDVERTAGIAASEMETLGIQVRRGIGRTGVVGDLIVSGASKCIALRADMDALTVEELGDRPYKSKIKGRGHMCGHDAHTAMLIGAARVLSRFKNRLKVNVRFVFQPSEEKPPGGAPAMIADDVLDGVDEIYAMHVVPLIETGGIGIRSGPFFAQVDEFEISITGKGGHAALPHLALDPIVIGCQYVTILQSIVSRAVDPLESVVVSVTRMDGGTAYNIIPAGVNLIGTVRSFKADAREFIREKMETMLSGITNAHGATYGFAYRQDYPVTINHEKCVNHVLETAKHIMGREHIEHPCPPLMGGEDFAYYCRRIPGCMILLGSGNRHKGIVDMCHDPRFDVDEDCMVYGMALHAAIALAL